MTSQYPGDCGFAMPSEWSHHAATIVAWPRNEETWPNNLAEAQSEFMQLLIAIARDEPVYLLAALQDHADIELYLQPYRHEAVSYTHLTLPTKA